MAKIKNGIFGQVSGKLGETVFYERNGIQVAQQNPAKKGVVFSPTLRENALRLEKLGNFYEGIPTQWRNNFATQPTPKEFWGWLVINNLKLIPPYGKNMNLGNWKLTENTTSIPGANTPVYITSLQQIANGFNGSLPPDGPVLPYNFIRVVWGESRTVYLNRVVYNMTIYDGQRTIISPEPTGNMIYVVTYAWDNVNRFRGRAAEFTKV